MALSERAVGQGTVGLGIDGGVVRLRGELFGSEVASGDYMGVAALGPQCLKTLPHEGCLVGDWALPHLRAGGRIQSLLVSQSFQDVGAPADYLAANLRWLASRDGAPSSSYLGEGVVVEERVELVSSVVGAGARLGGSGRIENSLILPGAIARAPLFRAIVTPAGVVMPAGCRADGVP
jgi:mannose-1-phosphate guanylyltransferase